MHTSSVRTESGYVASMENEAAGVAVKKETGKQLCTLTNLDICAECKQNFHKREPMLLPCLHSLCKTCVPLPWRSLVIPDQTGASPADQGSKSLNVIRCPVCRQECMDVDVMENFFVRDSVEMPSSTADKPSQLCMSCDDNAVASGFCEVCVEFLCVTCIDAHQRVKFTKDHLIRQQEELSQILRISTPKPVFCDVHKQEPLKLFCVTCDHPTCRDCQLLKHKDHNYQFLEDAYRNHRQNMEDMICQLQEKRKSIEEVSDLINTGIAQADENYTTVHNEIKRSMCSLILEINKKGKMLLNQLESLTKDHRNSLRKQQLDVSCLSKHLDHVITFTKWATGRCSGTALLHCKRLILFQIRNLLKTKCSTAFVPQSIVHFQCQSGYWASNVELGSLMVENIQTPQLNGFQGLYPVNHLGQAYPAGLPPGTSQQPKPSHSTLAQLQMQVERLAQQQPPPLAPPPHWSWCQSVPLPRPSSIRPQRSSEPNGFHPMSQQGRGFLPPHCNQFCPMGTIKSPGSPNQAVQNLGGLMISPGCPPKYMDVIQSQSTHLYSRSEPLPSSDRLSSPLSLQQKNDLAFSSPLPRPTFLQTTQIPESGAPGNQNHCRSPCAYTDTETKVSVGAQEFSSTAKRRRHASPRPIIIIKDEPEEKDDKAYATMAFELDSTSCPSTKFSLCSYAKCTMGPSLPDSTADQGETPEDGTQMVQDGSHHSTGVQTMISQLKTQDWLLAAQHITKEETLQGPQQRMSHQSNVLQQGTEGQSSQHASTDKPTQASQSSSGCLPSPDGCSNDTQNSQQSTEVLSKGHNERNHHPQPSQTSSGKHESMKGPQSVEDPGEGGCIVCQTGGELQCCDKCSKVYHTSCHIPPLLKPHCGQWFCTLCRDFYTPEMEYDSEILTGTTMENEASPMMKPVEKRKCERLLLQVYCCDLWRPLPSTCGSSKMRVELTEVKNKLESQQSSCYHSPAEFVSDVRIVFRNYFRFCETDSDAEAAAANLEKLFEKQLKNMFSEIRFP